MPGTGAVSEMTWPGRPGGERFLNSFLKILDVAGAVAGGIRIGDVFGNNAMPGGGVARHLRGKVEQGQILQHGDPQFLFSQYCF